MSAIGVRSRAEPSVSSKMAEEVSDTVDKVLNRQHLELRITLLPTCGCAKHVLHTIVSQPGGGRRVYLPERLYGPRKGRRASAVCAVVLRVSEAVGHLGKDQGSERRFSA